MQGVPPFDRKINDRHVDTTHDGDQCSSALCPFDIVNGRGQCNEAHVQKKQDQLRGQSCIPNPPSPPHGLAPQGTSQQGQSGKNSTRGCQSLGHHARQTGLEGQSHDTPKTHGQIHHHRHPRDGHMNKNDSVALPLLRINGGHHQAQPQTHQRQNASSSSAPRPQGAAQAKEVLRRCVIKPMNVHEHLGIFTKKPNTTLGPLFDRQLDGHCTRKRTQGQTGQHHGQQDRHVCLYTQSPHLCL